MCLARLIRLCKSEVVGVTESKGDRTRIKIFENKEKTVGNFHEGNGGNLLSDIQSYF